MKVYKGLQLFSIYVFRSYNDTVGLVNIVAVLQTGGMGVGVVV